VYTTSLYSHNGFRSVEILKLQLSDLASIHGVGPLGPEFRHIEFMRPSSDLFIRGKTDPDLPVFYFRVLQQIFHGSHDLSYPGLVISAKKGGAVGSYNGLSFVLKQIFKIGRGKDDLLLAVQD